MSQNKKRKSTVAVSIPQIEKKNTWSLNNPQNFKKFFYLIGCFAFLLYANTIWNDYNIDDFLVTKNHPLTTLGLSAIKEIFTQPYYKDEMGVAFGYRPIVLLSFAIEHQFFGVNVKISHFMNAIFYAICVMLFFKLLNNWSGQKYIQFAFVAALLFAAHPIHTEAVASLKNRDEILAFLFVMVTGILIHKSIVNNKLHWLFGAFFTFTIALLSKKSVYPVVFIYLFPLILFYSLSLKRLILIATILIIPAAIIASDLIVWRGLWMIILPYVVLLIAYFFKYILTKELPEKWLDFYKKQGLILLLILSITLSTFLFLHFQFYYFFIFSIILSGVLLWKSEKWGVLSLFIITLLLSFTSNNNIFLYSFLLILFFYFFYFKSKGMISVKKVGVVLIVSLLLVGYLVFNENSHWALTTFFVLSLFLFNLMIFKNYWLGILAIIINVLILFFIKENVNISYALILCASIYLKFIFDVLKWKRSQVFIPLFSLLILFIFVFPNELSLGTSQAIKTLSPTNHTQIVNDSEVASESKSINFYDGSKGENTHNSDVIREGRKLEITENPLIKPHSLSEKIATGWSILGEYLKLMILPINLSFYYGYAVINIENFSNFGVWLSVLIHLLMISLAFYFFFYDKKKNKMKQFFIIGVIWYFLSIVLFSNWIELVAGGVGERLAFMASGGFCIMISSAIFIIKPDFSFKKNKISSGIFLIVILIFSWQTINRNFKWKDPFTLVNNDIQHLQKSSHAHYVYAKLLILKSAEKGNEEEQEKIDLESKALNHLNQALNIDSNYYNAALEKGLLAINLGYEDTAIAALEYATEIYYNILKPYPILCALYLNNKEYSKLKKVAEIFSNLDENNLEAKFYLYKALMGLGQNFDALNLLQKTIKEFPDLPELKEELDEYYKIYPSNP